jgi:hypothetical protein
VTEGDHPRVQTRVSGEVAGWLDGRSSRMHTGSRHIQAGLELGLWRSVLNLELGRVRLTLGQANCLADVLNNPVMTPAVATRPGLIYAECYDAFAIARETPARDVSSYGAKWGPDGCDAKAWEQELLDYLGKLSPAADHALTDAIAKWWNIPDADWEQGEGPATDEEIREVEVRRFTRAGITIIEEGGG